MFVAPALYLFSSLRDKPPTAIPASGTLQITSSEISVEPHSTFWSLVEPRQRGELVFQADAGDLDIGINIGPVGDDGFTPALDQKVRDTQIEVHAGAKRELTHAVEPKKKYAVFVVNESDEKVKAKIKVAMKWGTAK